MGIKLKFRKSLYNIKNAKVKKNSILLISHELSYTGAPIVLLPLIDFLKKKGINVVVLSMRSGPLLNDLKQQNIKVYLLHDIYNQQAEFLTFARKFNFTVCNTIITSPLVYLLKNNNLKFMWWLHESISTEEYIKNIPKINGIVPPLELLNDVDEVYIVSKYASDKFVSKYNTLWYS